MPPQYEPPVRVIFVGGPLHGERHEIRDPSDHFWHKVPAGGALMYERRWRGREKMGRDGAVLRDHAFYAPVGMSESAYKEALQTIQFPD